MTVHFTHFVSLFVFICLHAQTNICIKNTANKVSSCTQHTTIVNLQLSIIILQIYAIIVGLKKLNSIFHNKTTDCAFKYVSLWKKYLSFLYISAQVNKLESMCLCCRLSLLFWQDWSCQSDQIWQQLPVEPVQLRHGHEKTLTKKTTTKNPWIHHSSPRALTW